MSDNKYVLAMYDVRGKQEFIFRTNKMKEMVGGSLVIRDLFKDYLYPSAKKVNSNGEPANPESGGLYSAGDDFKRSTFEDHLKEGYIGEVIYDGGGNFFVLYASKEALIATNRLFTKDVLKNIGTLRVLCSYIEGVDFNNYRDDEKRLRKVHRVNENTETAWRPVNALPMVQLDANTSMPIAKTDVQILDLKNIPTKTTCESYAKLRKYKEVASNNSEEYGEYILDNLVEEKGTDSMLAVIFIDGNNMGAQVSDCLDGVNSDYESCIGALRKFSKEIKTEYVENTKKAIEKRLEEKESDKKQHRMVVFAGDEMSFVCKAGDALDAVKAYFDCLKEGEGAEKRSSCAGIALFHSHAPYSEAYKIAEECCDNGKSRMKHDETTNACYIDFQYCQGGLGMDLETVRDRETGDLISKPWLYDGEFGDKSDKEKEFRYKENVEAVVKGLNKMKARTNVKGLVSAAKESLQTFDMEMERIYAHMNDTLKEDEPIKNIFRGTLSGERRRRLIYDIGIVYDQWFKEGEKDEKNETENNA